jgi:hypothetical protein
MPSPKRTHNHLVVSFFSQRPFPFTPKKDNQVGSLWIHQVAQDQILLKATLLNAAVHLDSLYERQASPLTLRHQVNTIRLVNESLISPEDVIDSIIGAVVLMAWTGVSSSLWYLYIEYRMHVELQWQPPRDADTFRWIGVVHIRGGLEKLGLDGPLHSISQQYNAYISVD